MGKAFISIAGKNEFAFDGPGGALADATVAGGRAEIVVDSSERWALSGNAPTWRQQCSGDAGAEFWAKARF